MHISRGARQALTVGLLLVGVIVATGIAYFTGHKAIAPLISDGGTLVVMGGAVLYIVFLDSRKRWPGRSAKERLYRLLTFQR